MKRLCALVLLVLLALAAPPLAAPALAASDASISLIAAHRKGGKTPVARFLKRVSNALRRASEDPPPPPEEPARGNCPIPG